MPRSSPARSASRCCSVWTRRCWNYPTAPRRLSTPRMEQPSSCPMRTSAPQPSARWRKRGGVVRPWQASAYCLARRLTAMQSRCAPTSQRSSTLRQPSLLRQRESDCCARSWPTESQHVAVLAPILSKLTGQHVTVRTLDFADDKLPPFLARGRDGTRLGRGLPLMLAEPAAFAHQFRAILSAGAGTDLHIMIPMVASVAELRACKEILAKCAAEAGIAT